MACAVRRSAPLVLSACSLAIAATCASVKAAEEPPHPAALDEAIIKSAARHGVPESLVRRVVMRESKYNPHARNHSFWGLMQISYPTAKSMGFRGTPAELLNPVTNLRYAVPYLANAFVIAGKRQDAAVRLYAHGYYDAAKRRGLLSALRTADSTPVKDVPEDVVAVPQPQPEESTGLFGTLFGPQQMPRDTQTEQAVYASAAPTPDPAMSAPAQEPSSGPAQAAATPTADGKSADDVTMAPDRQGNLHPPKSWQRDGGTTVIARGEQGVEQVAAYSKSADAAESHGRSRHRSHKSALFAALDAPPAGAQAYAAVAGGQDPRMTETESQAAIAQATSGQPVAGQPAPADPQQQSAAVQPAPAPQQVAADDVPAKKGHKRHVARRGHHHEDAPTPAVATQPQDAQQAGAPAQPSPQTADAGAAQQQSPQPVAADGTQAAAQPAPATDPSGQPAPPADASAPQASTQQASAEDPAGASSRKHKHRSRHVAHARKATDVAAQAPNDGEPQPTEFQPK